MQCTKRCLKVSLFFTFIFFLFKNEKDGIYRNIKKKHLVS